MLPIALKESGVRRPWVKNAVSILLVCAGGAASWAIAWGSGLWNPEAGGSANDAAVGAEVLGYLSAVAYLG